jgi:hypothetical protein
MCPGIHLSDVSSGTEAACPSMREHIVGILSSYPTGSGMDFFFILEKTLG